MGRNHRLTGFAGTATALLASAVASQELLWDAVGPPDVAQIGLRVVELGDVDADGTPDLLWGAYAIPWTQLWLVSGRDGQPLWVWPSRGDYFFRAWVACGDMDGDGIGDYAATLVSNRGNQPNLVEVRSGLDNQLIWSLTETWHSEFGFALLGDLDLDGDGRPDLVATRPRLPDGSPGPSVRCYANDGSLLHAISSTSEIGVGIHTHDSTLGRVGDVDGDGCDDFVVGGSDYRRRSSAAVLISGRTGQVVLLGHNEQPADEIGFSVDGCGDMDGDGVPDFVAGSAGFAAARGVVRVFSGRTGAPIHQWTSDTYGVGFEGFDVRSGGIDVDRDGAPDVLVAAWNWEGVRGAAFLFSGRDGSLMRRIQQPRGSSRLWKVAPLGVAPGHPFPRFATSESEWGPLSNSTLAFQGRVAVYRGSPKGAEVFGLPCRGTLATEPKIGIRDLGTAGARVTVYDAAADAPAILLLGASRTSFAGSPLPLPLDAIGLPCLLHTSVDVFLAKSTGATGIAAGYAAFELPLRPVFRGYDVFAQWLCLDPASWQPAAMSDALHWRIW